MKDKNFFCLSWHFFFGFGYHNVFMMLGAPGTAKTTVAEILGDILKEERLLKGNRFISINGAELKGKFVGWTTDDSFLYES